MSRRGRADHRYPRRFRTSRLSGMTKLTVTDPDAREKLDIAKKLLGGYAAVSVLALLAIVVFSGNPAVVTGAVWIRGSILAGASLVTFALGVSMANGSAANHRRVKIIALAQVVAIVVIESIPGSFPV